MQCPLCGTELILAENEIYFTCNECGFNEELMAVEELYEYTFTAYR